MPATVGSGLPIFAPPGDDWDNVNGEYVKIKT